MFAKKGFEGGRIETISKLSRTHDRMIYYYFGSKESLFIEVLKTVYRRMNEAEASLQIDVGDPVGSLVAIVHFTWQYYLDHPEFMTLLNAENLQQGKHLKKSAGMNELIPPGLDMIGQILEAGIKDGLFRKDARPRDLYIVIASLGYFYLSNRHTLSAFLDEDLMDKDALLYWRELISNVVLRSVMNVAEIPAKPARKKLK